MYDYSIPLTLIYLPWKFQPNHPSRYEATALQSGGATCHTFNLILSKLFPRHPKLGLKHLFSVQIGFLTCRIHFRHWIQVSDHRSASRAFWNTFQRAEIGILSGPMITQCSKLLEPRFFCMESCSLVIVSHPWKFQPGRTSGTLGSRNFGRFPKEFFGVLRPNQDCFQGFFFVK